MLPPLTLFRMDIKPSKKHYGQNGAVILGHNHLRISCRVIMLLNNKLTTAFVFNSLLVISRTTISSRQSIPPNKINETLNRTVWNKSPILSWFSKWKTCIFSPVWLSLNEHRQCIVSFRFSLVLRQHLISQVLKFTALRFRIYIEIILEGSVHVLLVSHTKLLVTYPYRAHIANLPIGFYTY